ncbi:CHAT domain-containing protein [Sphingobacterium faecium]|uniref:CHAT domain-containing protein n=1 Tax=Sphingobacterium faecium TaxID=34087 RepID=UPI003208077C
MNKEEISKFFTDHKFISINQEDSISQMISNFNNYTDCYVIILKENGYLFFSDKEELSTAISNYYHHNLMMKVEDFIDSVKRDIKTKIWSVDNLPSELLIGISRKSKDGPFILTDLEVISFVENTSHYNENNGHYIENSRLDKIDNIFFNKDLFKEKLEDDNILYGSISAGYGGGGRDIFAHALGKSADPVVNAKPFYFNTECPVSIPVGDLFDVAIYLTKESTKQGEIPVLLEDGWVVDVLINAVSGLEIEGNGIKSLEVRSDNLNEKIIFKLKSKNEAKGVFSILVLHDGKTIFREIHNVIILDEEIEIKNIEVTSQVISPPEGSIPDLTLFINEFYENGRFKLKYRLYSPKEKLSLDYNSFETPFFQQENPAAYFIEFFNDIDKISLATKDNRIAAIKRMEAKGANLYKSLMPKELRALIWNIKEDISTIVINSEEPWIPWELCYVYSESEGRNHKSFFLSEKFEIARWIQSCKQASSSFSFEKVALVFPSDSGLALAVKERNELEQIIGSEKTVKVLATYNEVMESFETGNYTAWHFSGHGTDSNSTNVNKYAILLEGKEPLNPEDIAGLSVLGKQQPIVFFNACQAGKDGMGLTGLSGWPKQFIDNGASVFIGAYWSVHDESAMKFAVEFYRLISSGIKIGSAFRQARLAIKEEGNPTWLAYTLYADPFAMIRKDKKLFQHIF